jgi:hypothetical protein
MRLLSFRRVGVASIAMLAAGLAAVLAARASAQTPPPSPSPFSPSQYVPIPPPPVEMDREYAIADFTRPRLHELGEHPRERLPAGTIDVNQAEIK